MRTVKKIKSLEKGAYPRFMRQLQDCRDLWDIADYCECSLGDLKVVCNGQAYMLASADEVCDLAGNVSPSFIKACRDALGSGWYTADLRERTANYLRKLRKRGIVELEEVEEWNWGTDLMVEVRFRFRKEG